MMIAEIKCTVCLFESDAGHDKIIETYWGHLVGAGEQRRRNFEVQGLTTILG
jgi:hypothetical protein